MPAASAPATVSALPAAASSPLVRPLRVGLVGVSGYAQYYWQYFSDLDARGVCHLGAAAIINPAEVPHAVAELAARGRRVFPDFETLLAQAAPDLDLCCLPVGITHHVSMSVAALEAGLHVLVEKPLSGCLRDGEKLAEAARLSGRIAAVGFQDVYHPAVRRLRAELAAGAIGTIRRIRVLGLWPRELSYYRRNDWAGRFRAGGAWINDSPIQNAFAHFANLALCLAASSPDSVARPVRVRAERYRCQPIETFDTVVAEVRTDTGVDLHLALSHSGQEHHPVRIVVEGDSGRVDWTHCACYIMTSARGGSAPVPTGDQTESRHAMFAAILARATGAEVPVFDIAQACEHLRLMQAVHLAGPTVERPPSALRQHRQSDDAPITRVSIPGLDALLTTAHERGCGLRALGCAWASAPVDAPALAFTSSAFPP